MDRPHVLMLLVSRFRVVAETSEAIAATPTHHPHAMPAHLRMQDVVAQASTGRAAIAPEAPTPHPLRVPLTVAPHVAPAAASEAPAAEVASAEAVVAAHAAVAAVAAEVASADVVNRKYQP